MNKFEALTKTKKELEELLEKEHQEAIAKEQRERLAIVIAESEAHEKSQDEIIFYANSILVDELKEIVGDKYKDPDFMLRLLVLLAVGKDHREQFTKVKRIVRELDRGM